MKCKLISLFTVLCMLCTILPAFSISAAVYEGEGTEENPYKISTANELAQLAADVNSGTDYSDVYFKLVNDIDLSEVCGENVDGEEKSWTPIGVYVRSDDKIPFKGTFDGKKHKILNLYINAPDLSFQGLFGCVGEGGTVKNLTVCGTVCGGMGTGGITAMNFGGTFENCCNAADVSGTSYVSGVGYNRGGTLRGCYNTGDISGTDYVAGVSACNENSDSSGCYNQGNVTGTGIFVGGVVGANENSTAENCYNEGTVFGIENVGGVIGQQNEGGIIKKCYNKGSVSGDESSIGGVVGYTLENTQDCYNEGDVSGTDLLNSRHIGGVIGYSTGEVQNCRNIGTVSTGSYIGGVVGYTQNNAENCYNIGEISGDGAVGGVFGGSQGAVVKYCYNTGFVSGVDTVGGISAGIYAGTETENCYNTGDITGSEATGGVIGYAEDGGVLKNCYNIGKLLSQDLNAVKIGGVAGCYRDGTVFDVINCYYLKGTYDGGIDSADKAGSAESKTAEEFAQMSTFENWDFENVWEMSAGLGRPIFENSFVHEFEGSDTDKNSYLISNLKDLEKLRDSVNGGNNFNGMYFKLTSDIDLSEICGENINGEEVSWMPIGSKEVPFGGIFDGDGHKITGLYINAPDENYKGLFGYIDSGAVKNLTVSGKTAAWDSVAGIVGWNQGGIVDNCVSECDVTGNTRNSEEFDISYIAAGGVVGVNYGTVTKCGNSGAVKMVIVKVMNDDVGGVAGENYGTVEKCFNTGDVSGRLYVGGIAGYNESEIKNCYSTGNVTSESYAGGIAGDNKSEIKNCYSIGNVTSKFYAGGGAVINKGVVENCYCLSDTVEAERDVRYNAEEKTAEEFADGTVTHLLQGAQEVGTNGTSPMVWGQLITGADADKYPVLTDDISKAVYKVTFTADDKEYAVSYANYKGNVKLPDSPKKKGYTFEKWSQTTTSNGAKFTENTAVKEDITVYAIMQRDGGSSVKSSSKTSPLTASSAENKPISNTQSKKVFADVNENDWYYDSVKYAYENKLFSGVADNQFAPDEAMTRAMLVTVLYRLEGEPDMSDKIWGYPFEDVDSEGWYGKAVYWARMNDIVNGYDSEKFAPDDNITREQIAAILQRYAKFKGISIDKTDDLPQFKDAEQISDWAKEQMSWAVGANLINGKGSGILDPLGNATRAETAALLQRFNLDIANEAKSAKTADLEKVIPVSEEKVSELEKKLYDYFGKSDAETGNIYVFEIAGQIDSENENYYLGRWQWNVDGHNSLLCEFVLKETSDEMYECTIKDNKIDWFEADNLIK